MLPRKPQKGIGGGCSCRSNTTRQSQMQPIIIGFGKKVINAQRSGTQSPKTTRGIRCVLRHTHSCVRCNAPNIVLVVLVVGRQQFTLAPSQDLPWGWIIVIVIHEGIRCRCISSIAILFTHKTQGTGWYSRHIGHVHIFWTR